ncbi:protein MGARP [Leptodactylus fuscus]
MYLCRNAWQKLAPLTHRGAAALLRNAPVRQMSSSVPGSSGEALPYYVFVAVTLTGGGYYAYHTVNRDKKRFHERHDYINNQLKPAFEEYGKIIHSLRAKRAPLVNEGLEPVMILYKICLGRNHNAVSYAAGFDHVSYCDNPNVETRSTSRLISSDFATVIKGKWKRDKLLQMLLYLQSSRISAPVTSTFLLLKYISCLLLEPYHLYSPPLKGNNAEASTVSETIEESVEATIEEAAAEEVTEQEEAAPSATLEQEQTVAGDEVVSEPTEQEPAPSTEAASEQVEPEQSESVGETLEETSPVLEASSENITEELASAAEDWSELTARKPEETAEKTVEETAEETAPAPEESEESVETEQASASS